MYSHETDHCLSCLLREPEQQKGFFARSGKQSNSVWTMLGSVPYILVIGHVLTVAVIGLVWKLVGGIEKHRLCLQTLPFLFPFALIFSLERLTSFWYRGPRELGNDLFTPLPNHRAECRDAITYSYSAKRQIWMRVGYEKLTMSLVALIKLAFLHSKSRVPKTLRAAFWRRMVYLQFETKNKKIKQE